MMNQSDRFNIRTALLGVSGLLSIIVAVFQGIQFFQTESVYTRQFSPWIVLYIFPIMVAIVFLVLAVLNYRQNAHIHQMLNWMSQHWTVISISLLSVSILVAQYMGTNVDLSNSLINLGMSGIGLLLYALVLIFIIYTVLSGQASVEESRFLPVTLSIIFITWILMSLTRFGLEPDTAFWNVAGVPVLWVSLASIILIAILLDRAIPWLQKRISWTPGKKTQIVLEIVLILAIWISASLIWANTPYSNSFFLTKPLPPDGHYWPTSDARLMDLGGQYLIIGGRLETPYFTEKPFYALFLGLLHFFFGQSYQTITTVQIVVLALIPVFLYLLGKKFSGRIFGLALAAFAIIKETNAILATSKISVSNSRLMMTELPTALLLIVFCLLIFIWLKKEQPGFVLPLLAGVTIGVAIFVRTNNIVVLFAFLGLLIITGLKNLHRRLPQIGIFLVGLLVVITPWLVYNQVTYGQDPLTWKIQAALTTRFSAESPSDPSLTPSPEIPSTEPSGNLEEKGFYKSEVSMILAHFLNNQVKALFVLPTQVYPANLETILDQEYWREPVTWNGQLPVESVVVFIVNLILISIGLTAACRMFGWAGLVPLILEIAYYLSNALVRTSGSRYLVAVDWVIYFYFLLGIFWVLRTISVLPSREVTKEKVSTPAWKHVSVGLVFALIIGLSLPVLNLAFPALYSNEGKTEVFNRLPVSQIGEEMGVSASELESILNDPEAVFLFGREIYPAQQEVEGIQGDKTLSFTLLTPDLYTVALPYELDLTERLPAGEDMVVVGCKRTGQNQILAYMTYLVQSDMLLWSGADSFKEICP